MTVNADQTLDFYGIINGGHKEDAQALELEHVLPSVTQTHSQSSLVYDMQHHKNSMMSLNQHAN